MALGPLLAGVLLAGPAVPQSLRATRTDLPIKIDGKLDDAAWRAAVADNRFTQKTPNGGQQPVEPTIVRVLYDDDALYLGIECVQTKAPIVARLTRRDRQGVEADWVAIDLGTRGDGKSAFEFTINAAGVLSDAIRFNDTDMNTDWDENWEGEVARTANGWTAEIKIPLRVLRFDRLPEQNFALQVRRYISDRQETDEWAFIPRDVAGEVSRYGRLENLIGLKPKSGIELRPFVVGTLMHRDPSGEIPGDPYDYLSRRGWAFKPSAGLDLKWHISQALTLDATVNPDFGQVEADQVILNLTTFETFYPEKRPFFLEGIDTFSTPLPLLYTRRIGLAPDLPFIRNFKPYYERFGELADPAPIYFAAKLSGDLGGGWSMSELLALTGREDVPVSVRNGPAVDRLAAPLTAFKLLRLKKDFGANAYVGGILMSTNRLEPIGGYPTTSVARLLQASATEPTTIPNNVANRQTIELCPLGETAAPNTRCFHDAYVGGLDAKWRPGGGDWVGTAQVVGTLMENGPEREQPDGTIIRSGDVGPAAFLNIQKDGGTHWVGNVQYDFHGKKTDYNDLGYMQRQNQHHVYSSVEYRTLEPAGPTNETHTFVEYYDRSNLELLELGRSIQIGNYTKYKNFWSTYVDFHFRPTYYDDREVGDGTALQHATLAGFEASFQSDSRKALHGGVWTQTQFRENGVLHQGQSDIGVNILSQWDVTLSPQWFFSTGEPRFFNEQGNDYLFGRQRGQNLSVTLRTTYTFTPRLTLQMYAQLFAAAVHYTDVTSYPIGTPHAVVHLADLVPFHGNVLTSPDFEEAALNANVVLRWEYRLGSTIFLVYNHGQDTAIVTYYRTDPAGFNFTLARPKPASDAFISKLSYWWG